MVRKKANREFWESASMNNRTYVHYYDRLTELAVSMFEWKNLPPTIDPRYMELALFASGSVVFFKDEAVGYLALRVAKGGRLNVYGIPNERHAIAANGYINYDLNEDNSVLIFNNNLHTNTLSDVELFARNLYDIDRSIYVNAKAQKTPILILCEEKQRLTLKNLYMKYDGNEPFIFGDTSLNPNNFKVLTTNAPYVADKLFDLKSKIWNDALTFLGISNVETAKKERLISDEVSSSQGNVIANRYGRLNPRRQACEQINEMFGLDIWCDYREDYRIITNEEDTVIGEPNSEGEGGEV